MILINAGEDAYLHTREPVIIVSSQYFSIVVLKHPEITFDLLLTPLKLTPQCDNLRKRRVAPPATLRSYLAPLV